MPLSCDLNCASAHSERLRLDYREAFRDWALKLDVLRNLPASAIAASVKDAKDLVNAAEVVYRDSRNRLTDNMKRRIE